MNLVMELHSVSHAMTRFTGRNEEKGNLAREIGSEEMKEPMIPGGYIMLSRKIIESEIWDKPPLYMKVWIYLLSLAQHTEYKGLKRGQLYTSIPKIREACSWYVGARKETPTAREVRNVLDWMRGKSPTKKASRKPFEQSPSVNPNSNMIVTTKVTHGMIVTIENYDVYQTSANYERHTERQDERQDETPLNSSGGSQYKQECIKNEKNDKEKDSWLDAAEPSPENEDLKKIEHHFIQRRGIGILPSASDLESMKSLLDDNIPLSEIIAGIDQAFDRYKPKHRRDGIKRFAYCETVIRSMYQKKKEREQIQQQGGYNHAINGERGTQDTKDSSGKESFTGSYYDQFEGLFGEGG